MTAILAVANYSSAAAPSAVQLHDQSIIRGGHGTVTASYTIAADGKVKNQLGSILESWLLSGTASSFEVMATVTSGSVTSGTTGSWLGCGSDRTWSVINSAQNNSTLTAVLSVSIRNASTGIVLAGPASITLEATSLEPFGGGGGGGP